MNDIGMASQHYHACYQQLYANGSRQTPQQHRNYSASRNRAVVLGTVVAVAVLVLVVGGPETSTYRKAPRTLRPFNDAM